tara:strand:+ start:706 stop:2106 length:1401 start_codon:yes stop_codon:yes gene_type:complete
MQPNLFVNMRRRRPTPYHGAVRVLNSVMGKKRSLESAWSAEASKLPQWERSRLRELCSGALRHYHRLDAELAPLIEREVFLEGREAASAAADPRLRSLMVLALYQSRHMEGEASSEQLRAHAIECCSHELRKPTAANLVSMVLGRMDDAAQGRSAARLSAASRLSLPAWLHDALRASAPRGAFEAYAPLLLQRPDSLCLNVSPTRWSPQEYGRLLKAGEWPFSLCGFAPHGVVLHERPRDPKLLPGLAEASRPVFVQDSVQQWGVAQLPPLGAASRVLDACAAPGGKSRALLHHAPHARLTAIDRNPRKVDELKRAGLPPDSDRVRIDCGDATEPRGWWDGELYDAIVLDVPCSGTGVLRAKPEVKHHQDPQSVVALCATQRRMLHALWPLLRPGGTLLYMSCSLLRSENDDAVGDFLRTTRDAAVTRITPPSGAVAHRTSFGVLFCPSKTHQGGFVSVLNKGLSD